MNITAEELSKNFKEYLEQNENNTNNNTISIGDLSKLKTQNKSSLVDAINEVLTMVIEGGITPPPPTIDVESVTLNETNIVIKIGESITLTATVTPDNATNKNVIWSVDDETKLSIENGIITALEEGSVVVTVSTEDGNKTASCNIVIENNNILVENIVLNITEKIINIGETFNLQHTINPLDATNKNVTWSSSNNNIASVDNGLVTGITTGNTTITVTTEDGNKTANCKTIVNVLVIPVTGIELSKTSAQLEVNDVLELNATIAPDNATNKNVTWSSSNNNIVSVNNGVITAKAPGEATIVVTTEDGDKTANCPITVNSTNIPVSGIECLPSSINIGIGDSVTLKPSILPNNATNKKVIFESFRPESVSVDNNGVVTAKLEGSVDIKIISEDNTNIFTTVEVIVNQKPVITDDLKNKVPYISNYYIKPLYTTEEDINIEYYVTDYEQKEYIEGDTSEIFNIEYIINGVKNTITNIKAGDNNIELGKLPVGKVIISIQAIDVYGRKSHRLFHEFEVKDPDYFIISEDKIYIPTAKHLLDTYNIHIDNTHPVETTAGLNSLIQYCARENYRKLIIPTGTYAIDENCKNGEMSPVGVHVVGIDDFIFDMNKSIFKLNPNALDKTMQITIDSCVNTRVVNGIVEGDLDDHDYSATQSTTNSEWVHGVAIYGSINSGFEDVTIRNIVGYGSITNFSPRKYKNTEMNVPTEGISFQNWVKGDLVEGELVDNNYRYTCDAVDLIRYRTDLNPPRLMRDYVKLGYLQVGRYLGYQGFCTGNWVYKVTLYDEDMNFIEEIEGYAYRRVYIPSNSRYARITLFTNIKPVDGGNPDAKINIYAFNLPTNSIFKNVKHEHVRAVGMSPHSFINMMVENCSFFHCGWALAKCAFDAEDGWDMMQDLTVRGMEYLDGNGEGAKPPGTDNGVAYLNCAGHNFVAENNNDMGAYQYEKCRSFVYRNNIITEHFETRRDYLDRSGYFRSYNNVFKTTLTAKSNNDNVTVVHRNEIIDKTSIYGRTGGTNRKIKLIDCVIEGDGTSVYSISNEVEFINCTFINYPMMIVTCKFINCTFNGKYSIEANNVNYSTFDNCIFNDKTTISRQIRGVYNNCKFNDLKLILSLGANNREKESFKFIDCDIISSSESFIDMRNATNNSGMVFERCNIVLTHTKPNLFYVQRVGLTVDIIDCTLVMDGGYIYNGNYNSSYMIGYITNIILKNCNVPDNVVLNKWTDIDTLIVEKI